MSTHRVSAAGFARFAVELHRAAGVAQVVETIAQFALQVTSSKHASLTLITRRCPELATVTDPKLTDLCQDQIETNAGPLIDAGRGETILITDCRAEVRWSGQWSERCLAADIASALHVPLLLEVRPLAVLSVYHAEPNAFDADDVAAAQILAGHAAVALAAARQEETLGQAADTRKVIGQALGILMERYNLSGDQAFQVLKRYSQTSNRKLRAVADELIETRQLPD